MICIDATHRIVWMAAVSLALAACSATGSGSRDSTPATAFLDVGSAEYGSVDIAGPTASIERLVIDQRVMVVEVLGKLEREWRGLREITIRFDYKIGDSPPAPGALERMLKSLSRLPHLESLVIDGLAIPSHGSDASAYTRAFEPLADFPSLRQLHFPSGIWGVPVPGFLEILSRIPKLSDLSIGMLSDGHLGIGADWMSGLAQCRELRRLRLRLTNCRGRDLLPLKALRHLEFLSLAGDAATTSILDPESLSELIQGFAKLRALELYDFAAEGRGIMTNVRAPMLEEVRLTGVSLEDDRLDWLTALPKLRRLELQLVTTEPRVLRELFSRNLSALTLGKLFLWDEQGMRREIELTRDLLSESPMHGPSSLRLVDARRVTPGFLDRLADRSRLGELILPSRELDESAREALVRLRKARPEISIVD